MAVFHSLRMHCKLWRIHIGFGTKPPQQDSVRQALLLLMHMLTGVQLLQNMASSSLADLPIHLTETHDMTKLSSMPDCTLLLKYRM